MKDLFNKAFSKAKEFYEYGTKGRLDGEQQFVDGVLAGINFTKQYSNEGASKMATKKPVAKIAPKAVKPVVKKVTKPVAKKVIKKVTFKARKSFAGVRTHIGTYATKAEADAVLALATTLTKATKLRKDYLKALKA